MEQRIDFRIQLDALLRQEATGKWSSYCPALEIASQGETETESLRCLTEAIEAWIESCHDRGVLDEVLLEVGFAKAHSQDDRVAGADTDIIDAQPASQFIKKSLDIGIPAFIAASKTVRQSGAAAN